MVDSKKNAEIEEFIKKFKIEFTRKFGFLPYVSYSRDSVKTGPDVSIDDVIIVGNELLKAQLIKEGYSPEFTLMSTERKRAIMDHRHAVFKFLYDIGYHENTIAKHFDTRSATVLQGIRKVEQFLSIRDPLFMNLLNNLENGIKELRSRALNSF